MISMFVPQSEQDCATDWSRFLSKTENVQAVKVEQSSAATLLTACAARLR